MIDGISMTCFGLSYAIALALEVAQLAWHRPVLRVLSLTFGAGGLLAQTLYIGNRFLLKGEGPPLSSPSGSMQFLAWILAIFYLYGSFHHRRLAWGIFVLPVVLGLVGLARAFHARPAGSWLPEIGPLPEQFWGAVHGVLLLLGAVGVCVGFVASVMYLAQARRLRAKVPPGQGLRLLSLERLEAMNRRAIMLAFPLLTAGVLVGLGLMVQETQLPQGGTALKVASTVVLWGVFALVLYLRHGAHLRGRPLALLTIVAFVLLLATLAFSHRFVQGGAG
jgi:ABC-type transport system involved in cytochrome c biogenesis permease subunit